MKTLYISDLDGTLLGSNGQISEFTRDTINDLVENGMNISLATARSISSANGIIEGLHLKIPAVMMNGVFLTDISTKEQKSVCYLPQDKCKSVIDVFMNHGRPPFVYSFTDDIDVQYTNYKNDYERDFIEVRKKKYRHFKQVSEYNISDKIIYINAIDKSDVVDKIAEDISKIDGVKFTNYLDTYSGSLNFIEVFSCHAGKWSGIKRLKEMYGFDRVVAFGDNHNDIEMLKNADVSVCVKNAQKEVLKFADVIVDTNDNDGVAKFLLKEWENATKIGQLD